MDFGTTTMATLQAQKAVLYGPEGIGKTLLAAKWPDPVFIDTEDSTKNYIIRKITRPDGGSRPTSWTMLLEMVRAVRDKRISAKTLVVDSLDWAEALCISQVCAQYKKAGIEEFGYGKGYTYVEEEWGKLLNLLSEVVERGINVVCTAHANMRRIELPEETGAYDHWEMKLEKKDAALVKEWADLILFCNYKTIVIAGANPMEKNKAQGGKRVMYSTHTPWWDAKNRHDLPEQMPLDYSAIAHIFDSNVQPAAGVMEIDKASPQPSVVTAPASNNEVRELEPIPDDVPDIPKEFPLSDALPPRGVPKELWDLMQADGISVKQVQEAVAKRGYYPANTPIENYDPDFIAGCLVACWAQVKSLIK